MTYVSLNRTANPATAGEVQQLRAVLASADEALQTAMATARRTRRTDDQRRGPLHQCTNDLIKAISAWGD